MDDCPLCELLIDVVRNSKHLTAMERKGFETLLINPIFGARELSIEAILQDFLVRVNTDPRATAKINACGLARTMSNPW
jgi:hypothetical protein